MESERLDKQLLWLQEQYANAKKEWVQTNNALKEAKEAHDENVQTIKELEGEIKIAMAEAGFDTSEFEDLRFSLVDKTVNMVDEESATQYIIANGLVFDFIKVTQAGLKKHKLTCFIEQGVEKGLKVESTLKESK